LGHYLLGESEYSAERFAVGVLMPACVLWGVGAFTPESISQICNVSQQAAQRRSERMRILRERNKFLTHPLERQVYGQFQKFIKLKQKS
ncbi:MAG: ImmA/IrrE family metallo-endopeptidase, partial [Ruminococcus sp.]